MYFNLVFICAENKKSGGKCSGRNKCEIIWRGGVRLHNQIQAENKKSGGKCKAEARDACS